MPILRSHAWMLALAGFALSAVPLCAQEVPAADDAESVAALIRQLGDEDFPKREAAERALADRGVAIAEALRAAAETKNTEVALRAKRLLTLVANKLSESDYTQAMATVWPEALKRGEFAGPLLGVKDTAPSGDPARAVPESQAFNNRSSVDSVLAWFSEAQSSDGHFDAKTLGAQQHADVEFTALALLAHLGGGHTEKVGRHKATVQKAAEWLKSIQRQDGALLAAGWRDPDGVAQALAGLALAEAAGMGGLPETKACAQRALDYSIKHHAARKDGKPYGFGRTPRSNTPDLLCTLFYVMQMRSAKVAGLAIDAEALDGAAAFLDAVDRKDLALFSLVPEGKCTAEATVLGTLARSFLGTPKEQLTTYAKNFARDLKPGAGKKESDALVNWIGTLALFMQGGELWKDWHETLKEELVAQEARLPTGAWKPVGRWAEAGPALTTFCNVLSLEVHYRYLPMMK